MSVDIDKIDWEKIGGMVPAIVQDALSMRVLMLGYCDRAALEKTLETGLATFYSRTKGRLWQKGETSGNVLRIRDIRMDCDNDALLMSVEPSGATCHLGTSSCFGDKKDSGLNVIADLVSVIRKRRAEMNAGSYTAKLFSEGMSRMAQKVGEEGVEVAIAAATDADELPSEAADLIYHLLVLLEASRFDVMEVMKVLKDRSGGR